MLRVCRIVSLVLGLSSLVIVSLSLKCIRQHYLNSISNFELVKWPRHINFKRSAITICEAVTVDKYNSDPLNKFNKDKPTRFIHPQVRI